MTQSILKGEVLKVLKQRGKTSIARDAGRPARLPGKKVSATGRVYWETRKNRTDLANADV